MIRSNPKHLRLNIDLGHLYTSIGNVNDAEKEYKKAIGKLPPDKRIVEQTANGFLFYARFENSLKTYEKGKQLLNNPKAFDMNIADVYRRMGDFDKMIDKYLDVLNDNPETLSTIQLRLGNVLNTEDTYDPADKLRQKLLIRSQKEPDDRHFLEMLLWLSIWEKDFDFAFIQAKAIDKRFKEDGQQMLELAQKSISAESYEAGIKTYNYILEKGGSNPLFAIATMGQLNGRLKKLNVAYQKDEEEIKYLKKDFNASIEKLGKNFHTINLIRDYAHLQAFHLNMLNSASDLLNEAIKYPGLNERQIAECKMELADILMFNDDVWEANLIFGQVEKAFKNEPIGHQAKFNRARLFYFTGDFEYAHVQLDVLRAATSKLIANDAMELSLLIKNNISPDSTYFELGIFANADLLYYQGKYETSLQKIDSLIKATLSHPILDDALYLKAETLLKLGKYSEADQALIQIIDFYPEDFLADDALLLRAEIQNKYLNNKKLAMELYEKIFIDYKASILSVQARQRYRELRGDLQNN